MSVRVSPEQIVEQRAKGWPDFHPEAFCHHCGNRNLWSWWVDSDRFNLAMAALGLDSATIVCPVCFVKGHEAATGLRTSWHLVPDLFHAIGEGAEPGGDQ